VTKLDAELDESDIRDDQEGHDPIGRGRQTGGRPARRDDDDDDDDDAGDEPPIPDYLPDEIRKLLQSELSVGPEIAGRAFGLGRTASYAAARKQEIPSLRIGHKLVCPTAPIRKMLGLEPSPVPPQPIAPPATLEQAAKPPRRQRRRRR
jgi:hypothetical protein